MISAGAAAGRSALGSPPSTGATEGGTRAPPDGARVAAAGAGAATGGGLAAHAESNAAR
jgi:hypothetical protein